MKRKLGVTYNVFNGEELLECSIKSIREQVDYVNIVWREYSSWTLEKANEKLEPLLDRLKKEGLVDNIIKFTFDKEKDKNYWQLRCKKQNLGIKDLKRNGCTHFMMMDADEFYNGDELKKAKQFIYDYNITHSACAVYDYRPLSVYRMRDVRDYSVGLIFKMTALSRVVARGKINNSPCNIDPHRTIPFIPFLHKFYYLNLVSMHHMTGVRKDYSIKMRNTLSNHSEGGKQAIKEYTELQARMEKMTEEEILSLGYIKVEDQFNILETWKKELI